MVVIPAYAKLNLGLEVVGVRDDGLHDIESVTTTIDWHDLVGLDLRVTERAAVALRLSGPARSGAPEDESNLAVRAAWALCDLAMRPVAATVWLDKHLPARAGLGGGSADAAAVLRTGVALLARCGIPVTLPALLGAAREIGADVPALLAGGTCSVAGAGERVAPLPALDLHVAVAVAGEGDTGAAYRALHTSEIQGRGRVDRIRAALACRVAPVEAHSRTPGPHPGSGRLGARLVVEGRTPLDDADLGSALEAPAARAHPELAAGLDRLRRAVPAAVWHLTGSGGCAFALSVSRSEAAHLAAAANAAGFAARACRTVRSPEADRFTAWP